VQSKANLLILDEPTNHLDLESREALEDALKVFPGSLILVSHDRALLDAVGTRTLAIEDRTLKSYLGGWADYVRAREEKKQAEATAAKQPAHRNGGKRRASQQPKPALSKDRKRRISAVETDIQTAEAALATLEDELADPAAWSTPQKSAESARRHERAKKAIEQLYEELGTLEA
jgi:ATP-binding cassette subfamily F protein 3